MRHLFSACILFLLLSFTPAFSVKNATDLQGSGASFPYPFFQKAFSEYTLLHNRLVTYSPAGSKAGYTDLKNRTVDLAGLDLFLSSRHMSHLPGAVLHIPITLNGIGIAYHLDTSVPLRLTASLLSRILIGDITHWNHHDIATLNPTVVLPAKRIVVITRAGSSGSTFILSQYLSYIDTAWKTEFGTLSTFEPAGTLQAKTSDDMAALIRQIPGSIGYISFGYQKPYELTFAAMENKTGAFIKPHLDSITAAANVPLASDGRTSCIYTIHPTAYPLTSFSWLVLYQNQAYDRRTKNKAQALYHLLSWMLTDGQRYAPTMGYSPLPPAAQAKGLTLLKQLHFQNSPLHQH